MRTNKLKESFQDSVIISDKISNLHQVGGIETSILDNGTEKGVRIAWINTGSGLRFKVVLDRAMNIADAFYNQFSLAWLSHLGITPGNITTASGMNWLHSFSGGLFTTCGLTHIGGPEKDEFGERGLHDRISHIPALVESIVQPDLRTGNLRMSITGRMLQSAVFGPHIELKRTIAVELGCPKINITDEVTNLGNEPTPHMLLYHFNFGWPLITEGTKLLWEGKWESRGSQADNFIFNVNNNFKTCTTSIEEHKGNGESVAFIDINPDSSGICECAIYNPYIKLGIKLRFKKEQLPWLTNWQHWGRNEYVTALEPGTHPPIGQSKARKEGSLIFIHPGETREYNLELEVVHKNKF
ncbi:MAG: aldose 1-epimerase family protein [Prolixibacteraceae bacterium]|jgi:galactose mutarotase-like enzyme|nr:aldose 1-epimerase family protein [Prolixibacteraceae bacterium]